jgi:hypothetical protein
MASFTEVGFTDAPRSLLDRTVAAPLLMPSVANRVRHDNGAGANGLSEA